MFVDLMVLLYLEVFNKNTIDIIDLPSKYTSLFNSLMVISATSQIAQPNALLITPYFRIYSPGGVLSE